MSNTPDAYCNTAPDGSCISTDPRCMHNSPGLMEQRLAELMRGLEIAPSAVNNPPNFFYLVGRAIADQAKMAPGAQTRPPGAGDAEPVMFADNGDEIEARLAYGLKNDCPFCHGSGHKKDVNPALLPAQPVQMDADCREGFILVKRSAVDWLREKFPALSVKSGLCIESCGTLYTLTVDDCRDPRIHSLHSAVALLFSALPGASPSLVVGKDATGNVVMRVKAFRSERPAADVGVSIDSKRMTGRKISAGFSELIDLAKKAVQS